MYEIIEPTPHECVIYINAIKHNMDFQRWLRDHRDPRPYFPYTVQCTDCSYGGSVASTDKNNFQQCWNKGCMKILVQDGKVLI